MCVHIFYDGLNCSHLLIRDSHLGVTCDVQGSLPGIKNKILKITNLIKFLYFTIVFNLVLACEREETHTNIKAKYRNGLCKKG